MATVTVYVILVSLVLGTLAHSSCESPKKKCKEKCVDLMTSKKHCGECDNRCHHGEHCVAGKCLNKCPPGFAYCSDTPSYCADTLTDSTNCGACKNVCTLDPQGFRMFCVGGVCISSARVCPVGQTNCGDLCVNLQTNPQTCGSCTTVCGPNMDCVGGTCVCSAGYTSCGGVCVDTQSDTANCGGCGLGCADPNAVCSFGVCQCSLGFTACSGVCVDTQADVNNCNLCGSVCIDLGTTHTPDCFLGGCTCVSPAETYCPTYGCTDLTTDSSNCNTCGNACPGVQTCVASTCQ